jgi:hypothetical protein
MLDYGSMGFAQGHTKPAACETHRIPDRLQNSDFLLICNFLAQVEDPGRQNGTGWSVRVGLHSAGPAEAGVSIHPPPRCERNGIFRRSFSQALQDLVLS